MDDIRIKYGKGRMTIYPDTFFPSDAARFKGLLKVINMDMDYENREIILATLKDFFQEQIEIMEGLEQKSERNMHINKQKYDMSRKRTEESKQYRLLYEANKSSMSMYRRKKNQFQRNLQQLEENGVK